MLHPDRFFDPEPAVRAIARELYQAVARLPLVCPHGHVDPRLFAADEPFPNPAQLIIVPDHYITRMLYSRGIPLEEIGVPRVEGGPIESDPRRIWQRFADHFHLFRGTPTGCWLNQEFEDLFGITEPLRPANAGRIYDQISEKLKQPEFRPRALYQRFNIEVLCTTDAATDNLEHHAAIRQSGWGGRILPTFRPDAVIDILNPRWRDEIDKLGALAGIEISNFARYIQALESRRTFFKQMGATATDHAAMAPYTTILAPARVEVMFERALKGEASENEAREFTGHMLMEMARMSSEDGLVMQLHPGSLRNHNRSLFQKFGPDKGADIPLATEYTRNLQPLLNRHGNDKNFRLILFTLDESTYSRELAPLAGHYPAVRLGPPWWFHDSLEGMKRYRQRVTETAGFYNTAGFNDDTRAFPSIPARHDLSRRSDANFLAGLVARHVIDIEEAAEIMPDLACNLARETYRLAQARDSAGHSA
jgi:glucuronate isomerase